MNAAIGKKIKFSLFPERLILPLTVKEAVEVWLPTEKVTVPESAFVTPLSVRLCAQPSAFIRFISLFCSGTSWSFHKARGASSCETRHSKRTSSPSKTTQLSKNFRMLTSTSVWQNIYCCFRCTTPSGKCRKWTRCDSVEYGNWEAVIVVVKTRQGTRCVTAREERLDTEDQRSKWKAKCERNIKCLQNTKHRMGTRWC